MKEQNATPKNITDLINTLNMPIPFDADTQMVQQHCNWDNLASDLKNKTIIEDCHFVS